MKLLIYKFKYLIPKFKLYLLYYLYHLKMTELKIVHFKRFMKQLMHQLQHLQPIILNRIHLLRLYLWSIKLNQHHLMLKMMRKMLNLMSHHFILVLPSKLPPMQLQMHQLHHLILKMWE